MSETSERYDLATTPQEIAHYNFIANTDRKSLYTQIKVLVNVAQEVASDELKRRRSDLKKLIEHEDKIYEKEFATKVKSRIDQELMARKEVLFQIKEESMKNAAEFLQQKRTQQYMESCYEVREMLRKKDTRNVKETHLEQVVEKERAIARSRELDKYWLDVGKLNAQRAQEQQCQENCLKREMAVTNRRVQEAQMQEHKEQRELMCAEKRREAAEVDRVIKEMRREEFDRKHNVKSTKVLQYRTELLQMMEERRLRDLAERNEAADLHRQLMKEIQAAEAAEIVAGGEQRRATHRALVDFIMYTRRMRGLMDSQRKMRDDRIDDLRRVDVCTKSNLQAEAARRARVAEQYYAQLRKQVCEEAERRLREEVERKENKILENRFVHEEVPLKDVMAQRRKYFEDLSKQIVELKRIRNEEDEKYHAMLMRATNDPEFCEELASQYLKEGTDYLEPHPNWRILLCPGKVYNPKPKCKTPMTEKNRCPACFGCEGKHNTRCTFGF